MKTFEQLVREGYKYVVIPIKNSKEREKAIKVLQKLQPKALLGSTYTVNTSNATYMWLELTRPDGHSLSFNQNLSSDNYLIFATTGKWLKEWDNYHKIYKINKMVTDTIKYNNELQ